MSKDFDIQKLSGSNNYHTWCFAMKNIMAYKGYADCITDPVKEKSEDKLTSCKAFLCLSVESSIYVHIEKCQSASEIWLKLKSLYEDRGLSRKIGILRSLISTRLDDCENMQDYIDKIKNNANKLAGIGFDMSDDWLGAIIMAGLNDSFRPFIMGLEASGGNISADHIISKLLDSNCDGQSSGNALVCKKKNKLKKYQRKCYTFGSKSHLKHECDKKKVKPDSAKNAFIATECLKETNNEHVAFLSMNKKNEWYIDSGASCHMTPYKELLGNYRNIHDREIITANNARMPVKYAGDGKLNIGHGDIEITDVLHVPNLGTNLLSVQKIVSKGNSVVFDEKGCTIYNKNGSVIANCVQENGVYKLTANMAACFTSNTKIESAMTWHRRLGHLNHQSLKKMRENVNGIDFNNDFTQIERCEVCSMGKQNRLPFQASKTESNEILQLIHSDLVGPMENQSIGHARYLLTFVDDLTKKVFVYFLKEKSQVVNTFIGFKNLVENQMGKKIKIFRTDNGTEYCNKRLVNFLNENGIQHQRTNVYTPQQNGTAERMNRTLIEKARCLLYDADLPLCYWAEAINMAAYLVNRIINTHGNIPDEIYFNKKIDISDLRIFGSEVMVHIPKEKRRKWDKKAEKLIFVGFDADVKGYRCINKSTRKLTISRDVKFLEDTLVKDSKNLKSNGLDEVRETKRNEFVHVKIENLSQDPEPEKMAEPVMNSEEFNNDENSNLSNNINIESITDNEDETTNASNLDNTIVETSNSENTIVELSSSDDTINDSLSSDDTTIDNADDEDYMPTGNIEPSRSEPISTRSKPTLNLFENYGFGGIAIVCDNDFAFKCDEELHHEDPMSVRELSKRNDSKHWISAMNEEMKSLEENNTWELVYLPKGKRAIDSKWIFKTKRDNDGKIVRYKARLVAKGFTQRYGIDYHETYAPVVRYTSIRLLMALAAKEGLKIHQMDAVTAFLQGEIEEEIYMKQPEIFDDGSNRVCKLRGALYGLKQAGRLWNKKLDAALRKFGLNKCKMDPCIYYSPGLKLIVAIYVDDFLIFYREEDNLNTLRKLLCANFKMKDIGSAKGCIGIRIKITANSIELDQSTYIAEMLKRFGMGECNKIGNPCDTNTKLSINMEQENVDEQVLAKIPYQEAVGSLLFIAQATRPDIAFAVNDVSRFNSNYGLAHWKAVKRIMRYLKNTINYKLCYSRKDELLAYSDSDWASDIDKRRSCTGYVFTMSGGAVVWKSTRQDTIALSSTEAEYMALSATVQEAIWLIQLNNELGNKLKLPIKVYCDNQSAIKLSESDAYRPRSKHIDIKYHHIREKIQNGLINIEFLGTNDMVADVLTKAITKEKLQNCALKMGLLLNH